MTEATEQQQPNELFIDQYSPREQLRLRKRLLLFFSIHDPTKIKPSDIAAAASSSSSSLQETTTTASSTTTSPSSVSIIEKTLTLHMLEQHAIQKLLDKFDVSRDEEESTARAAKVFPIPATTTTYNDNSSTTNIYETTDIESVVITVPTEPPVNAVCNLRGADRERFVKRLVRLFSFSKFNGDQKASRAYVEGSVLLNSFRSEEELMKQLCRARWMSAAAEEQEAKVMGLAPPPPPPPASAGAVSVAGGGAAASSSTATNAATNAATSSSSSSLNHSSSVAGVNSSCSKTSSSFSFTLPPPAHVCDYFGANRNRFRMRITEFYQHRENFEGLDKVETILQMKNTEDEIIARLCEKNGISRQREREEANEYLPCWEEEESENENQTNSSSSSSGCCNVGSRGGPVCFYTAADQRRLLTRLERFAAVVSASPSCALTFDASKITAILDMRNSEEEIFVKLYSKYFLSNFSTVNNNNSNNDCENENQDEVQKSLASGVDLVQQETVFAEERGMLPGECIDADEWLSQWCGFVYEEDETNHQQSNNYNEGGSNCNNENDNDDDDDLIPNVTEYDDYAKGRFIWRVYNFYLSHVCFSEIPSSPSSSASPSQSTTTTTTEKLTVQQAAERAQRTVELGYSEIHIVHKLCMKYAVAPSEEEEEARFNGTFPLLCETGSARAAAQRRVRNFYQRYTPLGEDNNNNSNNQQNNNTNNNSNAIDEKVKLVMLMPQTLEKVMQTLLLKYHVDPELEERESIRAGLVLERDRRPAVFGCNVAQYPEAESRRFRRRLELLNYDAGRIDAVLRMNNAEDEIVAKICAKRGLDCEEEKARARVKGAFPMVFQ